MWTDIDRIRSTPPAIICLTVISLVSSLINSLFFFLSRSSVPTFTNLQEETLIKIADVLDEVDNHIHIHYSCERSCREKKKRMSGLGNSGVFCFRAHHSFSLSLHNGCCCCCDRVSPCTLYGDLCRKSEKEKERKKKVGKNKKKKQENGQ